MIYSNRWPPRRRTNDMLAELSTATSGCRGQESWTICAGPRRSWRSLATGWRSLRASTTTPMRRCALAWSADRRSRHRVPGRDGRGLLLVKAKRHDEAQDSQGPAAARLDVSTYLVQNITAEALAINTNERVRCPAAASGANRSAEAVVKKRSPRVRTAAHLCYLRGFRSHEDYWVRGPHPELVEGRGLAPLLAAAASCDRGSTQADRA